MRNLVVDAGHANLPEHGVSSTLVGGVIGSLFGFVLKHVGCGWVGLKRIHKGNESVAMIPWDRQYDVESERSTGAKMEVRVEAQGPSRSCT